MAKGADIKAASRFSSAIRCYVEGTALFEAFLEGRLDIATLHLELGAAIKRAIHNPLVVFSDLRQNDVVRLLIAHGADVNLIDNDDRSSLSVACERGYDDLVELLLDHGADMNLVRSVYHCSPFLLACIKGCFSTVKLLVDRGADVNYVGERAPLVAACQHGQVEVAHLLLERGADVNKALKQDGVAPLMAAAACNRVDQGMIDLLLEYGANINAEYGVFCALNISAIKDRRDIVILLLERGADLYRDDGVTRIAYSTHGSIFITDPEIAALVVKYGESNKRAYRALLTPAEVRLEWVIIMSGSVVFTRILQSFFAIIVCIRCT